MSPKLDRLSELAKEDPKRQSFSTAHLITPEALYAAFVGLKKDASAGGDAVTPERNRKNAERIIGQLHRRFKVGKHRAQPLRRVTEEIPPVRFDGGPATNQQPDF